MEDNKKVGVFLFSSLSGSSWINYLTSNFSSPCNVLLYRDQGLHKLVFEDGGLPDGTEVAYYSRGKVVDINSINSLSVYRVSSIM